METRLCESMLPIHHSLVLLNRALGERVVNTSLRSFLPAYNNTNTHFVGNTLFITVKLDLLTSRRQSQQRLAMP